MPIIRTRKTGSGSLEPVRSEEELNEKPEQQEPENQAMAAAVAPPQVKFTGQQPGEEGVEVAEDEEEDREEAEGKRDDENEEECHA